MSAVIIGDRAVGKTCMTVAIADPSQSQHIRVVYPEYESWASMFVDPGTGMVAGTPHPQETLFILDVNLPSREQRLGVQLTVTDTPGEVWESTQWRQYNPSAWQDIKQRVSQSQGVLLLLPPYRGLIQENLLDSAFEADQFPTSTAWLKRLADYLDFFRRECSKVNHILICINKADLFCNVELESKRWRYKLSEYAFWFEYNNYIYKTYFNIARNLITQYNSQQKCSSLRFFITTIKNRALLELPWIYLNTYLVHYGNAV